MKTSFFLKSKRFDVINFENSYKSLLSIQVVNIKNMLDNITKFIKTHISKLILILIGFFIVSSVYAATSTWHFTSSTDYTYSSSTGFTVIWTIASLNKNTLVHTGVVTSATDYNWAYDVVVDWNYAYITNFVWNRVTIVNISNPSAPTFVWRIIDTATNYLVWVTWIVKEGNLLYVASNTNDAIQIIDVSNPAVPILTWSLVNATNLNWARWLAKSWSYLYVANDQRDSVAVVNVSNPTAPTYVREIRNTTSLNWARDIKIVWSYAYVAWYDWDRFTVLSLATPDTPTIAWSITDATNLNWAHQVEVSWNYAYVSAYLNNTVRVIDISTPATPVAVTNISWTSYSLTSPRDLIVDWNYIYISSLWLDAVNIADISNPAVPVFVSKVLHNAANPLLDWVDWLFKVWDLLYSAVYNSDALEILKLSYPTNSPYIQPVTAFGYWTTQSLLTFSQTLWAWNEWTVTYQISKNNGTTWYYWNWTAWTTTTWGVAQSSSAAIINSNLSTFNAVAGWTGQFTFRAYFTSNWTQKVELDNIDVTATDPESPGWVSSNMALWFKANEWTSTTTDWASLTTWNDQSGNWFNVAGGVSPVYQFNTASTGHLNYNPIVSFNWTTQYLENLNNWANSTSYFMVIVPNSQVDWTLAEQMPFWWDCTSWVLSSWACWLTYAWLTFWAFTVALNDEVITHALWSSANYRSAQIGAYSYDAWRPMLMSVNQNSTATWTDIFEKWVKIDNTYVNTYQTLATADFRIGWSIYTPASYYNWKIAEIINYRTRVSDTDRQKVESYLAIKYGITLNAWTENYISSDWTTSIWNTTTAGTFIYDVFGIWRDDISWLSQIKSKSMNADWIVTINALSEWTNITPSFVDMANREYLSISNNVWANTWSQSWNPTWYDILTRQWRVQETGDVWTVSLDFDVANSAFDVPLLSTGTIYYFLYDTDNDNLLSDETPLSMTNTAWTIWQISWVNLQNWQEFTLASLSSSNNIPTNITLSNSTINENVAIWTTVWTFSTTDADSWDTHTYSLVTWIWDEDNVSFTIVWSSLRTAEIPDYEIKTSYNVRIETDDWNGWTYQKQFTINISNLWETINSILDFETPGKYTLTSWNWSRLTTNPYENSYSIWSNNGWLPNTQSCFEVNNTFSQTGTITFRYYVSSDATDYLRFYIDNVDTQAWSGIVPWALYTNTAIAPWTHTYKWCYIKDWGTNWWTDNAYVDYITYANSTDTDAPVISSFNYASWYLLPWWNHTLAVNYLDWESWVNTSTDLVALYKWNWTTWGPDISATGLNLASKTVSEVEATYPTNNLSYWKYNFTFQISDNYTNTSSSWLVFYIDEPEIIISTWSLDLWGLSYNDGLSFSDNEITATIRTVWASFELQMSKDSDLLTSWWSILIDWDWSVWVWYDKNPYTLVNKNINANPIIWTWATNVNVNWAKNVYIFPIKIGTLITEEQTAWSYEMNISFRAIFGY